MPTPDHSIAGLNLLIIEPSETSRPRQQAVELIRERGVDGVRVLKTGLRGPPFRLLTVRDNVSDTSARQHESAYAALVGTVVELKEWDGTTRNVLVRAVSTQRRPVFAALGHVNAFPTHMVFAQWELERVD